VLGAKNIQQNNHVLVDDWLLGFLLVDRWICSWVHCRLVVRFVVGFVVGACVGFYVGSLSDCCWVHCWIGGWMDCWRCVCCWALGCILWVSWLLDLSLGCLLGGCPSVLLLGAALDLCLVCLLRLMVCGEVVV